MGLKDRCNLQFDGGAGVLGQLHVVLFASKLINDVVARESIFKDLLCGAGLLSLGLSGLRSFHLVASDGAANDTNHGGDGSAFAFANGIANGAACNGSHGSAGTGGLAWHIDLRLGANLARDRHLLVNGGTTNDVANLLGLSGQAKDQP